MVLAFAIAGIETTTIRKWALVLLLYTTDAANNSKAVKLQVKKRFFLTAIWVTKKYCKLYGNSPFLMTSKEDNEQNSL